MEIKDRRLDTPPRPGFMKLVHEEGQIKTLDANGNEADLAGTVDAAAVQAALAAATDEQAADMRESMGVAPADIEAVTKATPSFQKAILNYVGQNASPQIRIVTLADSWELSLEDPLAGIFGWGGRIVSANRMRVGIAGDIAAMQQNGFYSDSPMGTHHLVANGQTTIVGRNGDDQVTGNVSGVLGGVIRVLYKTEPGAGTLEVETDVNAGGVWTSRGSINADAAEGWAEFLVTSLTPDYYRVRVRGTTAAKTVKVFAMGVHEKDTTGVGNNRRPGVVRYHISGDGRSPTQLNTVAQGYWTAALGTFAPHLVFIRTDDLDTEYSANLATLIGKIRTASPSTEIVLLGSHETNSGPDRAVADPYLRAFAAANNCAFIDLRRYLPSYATMNAAGMMQDTIHMNGFGNRLATAIIAAHFPALLTGRFTGRDSLTNVGKPVIDQEFSGLTGSLSFAEATRSDIWLTGQNIDGNALTFPTRGRIGFLKSFNANYRLDHAVVIAAGASANALATFKEDTWAGIKFGRDMVASPASLDGAWFEILPFVTSTPAVGTYVTSGQTAHAAVNYRGSSKSGGGTLVSGRSKLQIPFAILTSYANDAAAAADADLPTGGFYKITGSNAIYSKP